jgi:hypothetical protein
LNSAASVERIWRGRSSFADGLFAAGDFLENFGQQPFAVFDYPLLVAGRAKMATLARKRQKIFVAAFVASNPGEAASQIAAIQIPIFSFSF